MTDKTIIRAERLIREGQHLAAVELLQPKLGADPSDYWVNFHLGRAYAQLKDRDRATAHLLTAASGGYSEPVAAMYELVREDLANHDFGRVAMLEEALAMPGDLHCKFPATSQKMAYHSQLHFLSAMVRLREGDYEAAERHLAEAYGFSGVHSERTFRFGWVMGALRRAPDLGRFPHLEYVRHAFLRINMRDDLRYDALLGRIDGPVDVLEVGGMDGVRFDPIHRSIVEKRWNAVVLEPLPDIFALLQATYAGCDWVRCVNLAISEQSGPLRLFRVKPEIIEQGAPDWMLGISSAFKGPDLTYFESAVVEEDVRALTFEDFVSEYEIRNIDVLQIDTEGYDWRVLRQIDLDRWNITLINAELLHVPPPDRLAAFNALHRAGYDFTYDGMNVIAVRRGLM